MKKRICLILSFSLILFGIPVNAAEINPSETEIIEETMITENVSEINSYDNTNCSENLCPVLPEGYLEKHHADDLDAYLMNSGSMVEPEEEIVKATENIANSVISSMNDDWSDMEKALYLHDWLCNNTNYDYTLKNQSLYNAILDHSAICNGYASAYAYLMRKAGILCLNVASDSLNHAWNLALINNKFYYIDTTWDGSNDTTYHNYFLLSRDAMYSKGHNTIDWQAYGTDPAYECRYNDGFSGAGHIFYYIKTGSEYDKYKWTSKDSPSINTAKNYHPNPIRTTMKGGDYGYIICWPESVSYDGSNHIETTNKKSKSKNPDITIKILDGSGNILNASNYKIKVKNNKNVDYAIDNYEFSRSPLDGDRTLKTKNPFFKITVNKNVIPDNKVRKEFNRTSYRFSINPANLSMLPLTCKKINKKNGKVTIQGLSFVNSLGKKINLKLSKKAGKGDYTVTINNNNTISVNGVNNYTGSCTFDINTGKMISSAERGLIT